ADQVVALPLELPVASTMTGRFVDPAGEPLGGWFARIELQDGEATYIGRGHTRTDEDGAWTARLTAPPEAGFLEFSLSSDPREHLATLDLAGLDLGGPSLNLGTVTLVPGKPPERLLVSGRVLDAAGEGLRRAYATVYGPVPEDRDEQRFTAWVRTGKGGKFELMSQEPDLPATLELHVSHDAYESHEPLEVALGTTGLDVVLTQGASIRTKLTVETDPLRLMEIVARLESDADQDHKRSLIEGGGTFNGLQPGLHEVSFEIRSSDWILESYSVDLAADERYESEPIDLTGRTRILRLVVLDLAGEPADRVGYHVRDADGTGTDYDRTDSDGQVFLLLPTDRGPMTLYVGKETFALPETGDSHEVRLGQ
ncbi:MAG: carboxypeptidase regulatory-like domain-containing protein, partial [Proteobacteria bacterium]|nr:carboxypeptidase regulatory-like domain-containing protein [Pseudomonadota bacterium]